MLQYFSTVNWYTAPGVASVIQVDERSSISLRGEKEKEEGHWTNDTWTCPYGSFLTSFLSLSLGRSVPLFLFLFLSLSARLQETQDEEEDCCCHCCPTLAQGRFQRTQWSEAKNTDTSTGSTSNYVNSGEVKRKKKIRRRRRARFTFAFGGN